MDYVIAVCRKNNVDTLHIDFIEETIKPGIFKSKRSSNSITAYKKFINRNFDSFGISWSDIKSIELTIKINFESDKKIDNPIPDDKTLEKYLTKDFISLVVDQIGDKKSFSWYADKRKNQIEYNVIEFETNCIIGTIHDKKYTGSVQGVWKLFDDNSIYMEALETANL